LHGDESLIAIHLAENVIVKRPARPGHRMEGKARSHKNLSRILEAWEHHFVASMPPSGYIDLEACSFISECRGPSGNN
jgi:hypothetical protein